MIGEVTAAAKAVETTVKAVEVVAAKEAAKETTREIGKTAVTKSVDISKRLDVSKKAMETKDGGVDITKRIKVGEGLNAVKDINSKSLSEVVKDYVSDLKAKSDVADTLKDRTIDATKLRETPAEEVKKLREDFDDNKAKIRSEWEKVNNREWPRYEQDVYNKDGVRVRKAGDCYDAHHIQPLKLGGTNDVSNITPLDITKHQEVHSSGGSCTKLVEKVMGGKA